MNIFIHAAFLVRWKVLGRLVGSGWSKLYNYGKWLLPVTKGLNYVNAIKFASTLSTKLNIPYYHKLLNYVISKRTEIHRFFRYTDA